MGTPLIQDSFHGNRWDYVYQMRESGKITEQRRVILDFENELLKSVRGDVAPSASDKATTESAAPNAGPRTINPTPKPQEKGMLDKLKFWKKDEVAPAIETKPAETKSGDTKPAEDVKQTLEAFEPPEMCIRDRVTAIKSDMFSALKDENHVCKKYDIIISNPPYVDAPSMAVLPAEYQNEPQLALGSGTAGLDHTHTLLREAANYLNDDGILIVEIGHNREALEAAYPNTMFNWQETSSGNEFVFLLTKEQLI